jgi:superfamily II DNA/RNA helicase
MENRLEELASVLDWLDDIALAPKWRLAAWHTYAYGDGGSGVAGAKNLDTLRERLEPVLVRRVRAEVLKQLPPRTDTRVSVAMTPEQQEEHDALIPSIAQLLARGRHRPLTQAEFLRLMTLLTQQRMISNGLGQVRFDAVWPAYEKSRPTPALLEGLFAPKLLELRRVLESVVVEQGRKVVVFSQWRKMLRLAAWAVADILRGAGRRPAFFTGAESQAVRTRSIVDFHDDPDVAVMFLTDAGGVGLNLQRAASCCINLELPWNPAVLEQRIGRIYRLGQQQPIDVYNLVCEQGIESRIAALVSTKKALFTGLFDGTSDEVRFDGGRSSFLHDVEKLVPEVPDLAGGDLEEKGEDTPPEELTVEASDRDEPALAASPEIEPTPAVAHAGDVSALLRAVRVERTAGGGVRLEAPPEAAASLVALFEGMSRLLAHATAEGQPMVADIAREGRGRAEGPGSASAGRHATQRRSITRSSTAESAVRPKVPE